MILPIIAIALIVEAVAFMSLGTYSSTRLNNESQAQLTSKIRIPGELLVNNQITYDQFTNQQFLSQLTGEKVIEAIIIKDDTIFYSSSPELVGQNATTVLKRSGVEDLLAITQGVRESKYKTVNKGKSTILSVVTPLYQENNNIGYAYIEIDISALTKEAQIVGYTFALISFLCIVLTTLVLAVLIILRVIRPLARIVGASNLIAGGNLDISVEIKTKDEIGELAIVFNQMTKQLKESYMGLENKVKERTQELEKAKIELERSLSDANALQQAIKEERDKARAIVTSMGEGVFAIDKDMKIVLMNSTAEKSFEVSGQQVIGRSIVEIVPGVLKNGQELPVAERPTSKTLAGASMNINVDDNYSVRLPSGHGFPIALATTPLRGEQGMITGVVMVFRDITPEKQSRSAIEQQVAERTQELQEKNTALIAAKEEISRGWLQIQMEKARLLGSVNSITLGFLMVDVSGKTLIKNPAVEKTVGIKADYSSIDSMEQIFGRSFAIKAKFNKCIEERSPVSENNLNFNNKFFSLYLTPIFSTDNTLSVIGVAILIQNQIESKVAEPVA